MGLVEWEFPAVHVLTHAHRRHRYENANRRGGGGEGDDDDALAPALVVAAMAVQPHWPACMFVEGNSV